MSNILDREIHTEHGRLFSRIWSGDRGDVAPILLFHDSLGSVELWRTFPEKLATATGHPVIAYDRLGFGKSDPYPGRLPFDFVRVEARQVVPAIRAALGFDRFVACGHSVGGGMAVETAAAFGDACLGLVTLGAQAFVDERILGGIRQARDEFARPETLARLARYHREPRWAVDAWVETWLDPAFADYSLDEALSKVSCPVLALHGENDQYGSIAHACRIASERGRTVIMKDVGHVLHRENEAGVVQEIATFLLEVLHR